MSAVSNTTEIDHDTGLNMKQRERRGVENRACLRLVEASCPPRKFWWRRLQYPYSKLSHLKQGTERKWGKHCKMTCLTLKHCNEIVCFVWNRLRSKWRQQAPLQAPCRRLPSRRLVSPKWPAVTSCSSPHNSRWRSSLSWAHPLLHPQRLP
jgi:hypothetical protein